MLETLAWVLDPLLRRLAPCLPGVHGGGVARWEGQPLTTFDCERLSRGIVLRGFGLQLVLDRDTGDR